MLKLTVDLELVHTKTGSSRMFQQTRAEEEGEEQASEKDVPS